MLTKTPRQAWFDFLEFVSERCSSTEFENWFASIHLIDGQADEVCLEVPNIFVQEYLLDNYKKDLLSFLPLKFSGEPAIAFVISEAHKKVVPLPTEAKADPDPAEPHESSSSGIKFNPNYTFENFIEGPANQFVKSAAIGVASRPGKSYNPLFIHGGVGLGKTHLLPCDRTPHRQA